MGWNYRIIRHTKRVQNKTIHLYSIHEVYYNKKDKPYMWTSDDLTVANFESVKDLKITISMMLTDALKHPVLEIKKNGKKEILVERKVLA